MGPQILVHFVDGSTHACDRESAWSPLEHEGEHVEWCAARGLIVLRVVAVRLRAEPSPILGASIVTSSDLGEREARSVLEAHGGRRALRPLPSTAPLRRVSDKPKKEPWFVPLTRLGFVSDQEITNFLSQTSRVPTIDLRAYVVAPEIIGLLSRELCSALRVLPVSRAGGSLIVAMADPTDHHAIDELASRTGFTIEPVIASEDAIATAIRRYYGAGSPA